MSTSQLPQIPEEFNYSSKHGFTMNGWNFTSQEIQEARTGERMLNPAFELASNQCPWNCEFCFTEQLSNQGLKKSLKGEFTLQEKLLLIDQAANLGTKSINLIGAGEPTIDKDFFPVLEKMYSQGITPIVYTEGTLRLGDKDFAKRVYDLGATVVLKVNSLKNESYQNAILDGPTGRKVALNMNYFKRRAETLELLIDMGFNKCDPTRLAFDTIICQENVEEIPEIHRFARQNNIFVLFVNYLTSGRSVQVQHNAISREEQFQVFKTLEAIDRMEFGMPKHATSFPYAGGVPCSIRGFGVYVKIQGEVHDCPGESERLGNIRETSLIEIWQKQKIQKTHDFGCLPRKLFWDKVDRQNGVLTSESTLM